MSYVQASPGGSSRHHQRRETHQVLQKRKSHPFKCGNQRRRRAEEAEGEEAKRLLETLASPLAQGDRHLGEEVATGGLRGLTAQASSPFFFRTFSCISTCSTVPKPPTNELDGNEQKNVTMVRASERLMSEDEMFLRASRTADGSEGRR